MMTRNIALAIGLLAGSTLSQTAMADSTPSSVADMAESALARGYGTMCSLEMTPVSSNGYYPCIDFGPYRYVRSYGKTEIFVIQQQQAPFRIASGQTAEDVRFVHDGPWNADMPIRMMRWWNDTVEGMAAVRSAEQARETHRNSAAGFIDSLNENNERRHAPAEVTTETAPTVNPTAETEEAAPSDSELSPEILEILTR